MYIPEIITTIRWWYWTFAIVLSLFYAIRGIIEHKVLYEQGKHYIASPTKKYERFFIFYAQDFLFKMFATISGFITLYLCVYLFPTPTEMNNISSGRAILLIFLFVWGITGICGYLTLFISRCKIPGR